MEYVIEKNSTNYNLMGGKATALSKMGMIVDNISDWFVVSYTAFDMENKCMIEDARKELESRLNEFSENEYFAIRSSATNEDSTDNSFAGQFDTFLYIRKDEVINKVLEVFMSAFSERIETYRKENNINEITIPSAIVQKMVKADKAGVAFGANPVNSNVKEVVVTAVYGLGSGLVDGIATADTYTIRDNNIEKNIAKKDFCHVFENGNIVQKEVENNLKDKQILNKSQILEVKELVNKASKYFGRFQDIEWAYEGDKLYLLQSRPITTLSNNKDGKINVFDNSNIVESYGGITTPLTFSFIRMVYENVYIELCKIFNVKQEKIEMNSQMFKNMLALIDGRVYYNLYGWYGMLSMFPGLGNNKKFMEQMMGVKESLPDSLFPVPQATFKDKIGLLSTGYGLIKGFLKIRKMTEKFYNRLNDALEDKNIENMDLYELHDYYYELEKKLLHKWDAPLVNDFLAMIFYGNLKKECKKIFKEDGEMIHNDLLCGEGGIISSEPAKRIKEMAKEAKENEELLNLLESNDVLYIQKEVVKYTKFNKMLNEYLDKFSDRCLQELKLETLTLKDNPLSLYASIATFARRLNKEDIQEIDEKENRIKAENKVKETLRYKPVEKAKFAFLLKQARYTVKNRENLRFERTLVFGRVRELFLRIGFILTSMNVIEDKRDIFYLEVDEILFYIDGKSTTNNLKELIEIRKEQYLKYNEKFPDERFYSYGAVNVGNTFKMENKRENKEKAEVELSGIGASPGIVKGKVRIIKNPANAKLEHGEILVAEYTDPGWIMLFPAASGILVERGSLLSHSAIVSRELGIPAVVGITGLINSLNDGDEVELDGTTGKIIVNKKDKNEDKINNLKDLLNTSCKNFSDKILYRNLNENITYKEFLERINSLGASLMNIGLENKKIAILSENRYEWELTYFAIACGKGIVVPIDRNMTKMEIENIINKANVETIFCSRKYEDMLNEIKQSESCLKNIISFDSKEGENSFTKLIENGKNLENKSSYTDKKIDGKNIACIFFTSGTTSTSKAVMLSHENICFDILNASTVMDLSKNDVALSVLPLSHVLEGLFCFLVSIHKGLERVFCNEIDEIIDYIIKYNITYMGAVPAIYEYLYKRKDELIPYTKNINMFMSGGAKLSSELVSKYKEIGITLIQGYGLTECAPVVGIENKTNNKLGSVGKAIPNIEVKLENKDASGIGEIAIKGKNIFQGYYEDENKTKESIKEGWFYTGDLGKLDEDGYLYICGRTKEFIVLQNGEKVFPEEIETLLNKIDGIKESFVFEKETNQNDIKLYSKIVYDPNRFSGKEEEIKSTLMEEVRKINELLPQYKMVKDIYITTSPLEKTLTGKIKRIQEKEKIKEDCEKIVDNDVSYNKNENSFEIIKQIFKNQLGECDINENSHIIKDLGADSLDIVELFLQIEKQFNITIPKEQRKDIKTVKDIIDIVILH